MLDPYENGTPKYSTAQSVYDALCDLVLTEEMGILSEIGVDVSYDNQTYYYTDKGNTLKGKFEQLSYYGDKMWLMELAVSQMDQAQIHDTVFEALCNPDLAKRIGFKRLFIDYMLRGDGQDYKRLADAYAEELRELDYFEYRHMVGAWNKVMEENGTPLYGVTPYSLFSNHLIERVRKLELFEETRLIAESRAHLSAYDDFILGLRVNQALYERQEWLYTQRVKELQAAYNEKTQMLLHAAERAGLLMVLIEDLKILESDAASPPILAGGEMTGAEVMRPCSATTAS